ncbi:MAG TPA: MerR family transcriptional regulator, partial [Trueperaceae bacterium]
MGRRFYRTGQFAKKAAVSVRTLRYYDKQGLLSPTDHTDTGYRLYSDDDLSELQQILALKFLGFTLEEIRAFRQTGPERLGGALANQKAMMQDRRAQIEAIIDAIEHAQKRLAAGACDWDAITHVIEVMQMENKKEWVDKYFTPEQRATMERLSATSYSDKAKRKMAGRSAAWTEQDQKRVDAQYAHIAA